jgi:site-specific DNA-methyltransferase (adenine-specific)
MFPFLEDRFVLECCDALSFLHGIRDRSIDSLVTDPPAGLVLTDIDREGTGNYYSYDGALAKNLPRIGAHKGNLREHFRARDKFITSIVPAFEQCRRVLKPGSFGVVWASPKTSHWTAAALEHAEFEIRDKVYHLYGSGMLRGTAQKDLPEGLQGWNTTLAPGAEEWILVRVPPEGPIGENYAEHGVGAINVEACKTPTGRLPKNVLLGSQGVADVLHHQQPGCEDYFHQFRYASKPSPREKEDNQHPTVKPIELMQWLTRLVTPDEGVVLDPFAGSGSTGIAAQAGGFTPVMCEIVEEYVATALPRMLGNRVGLDDLGIARGG